MRLVFANFAHYKLIIIFSHPKRMATVEAAQIYTHTCMCITYSVHILTLFTDFSSSRINVNANLYFLNGRGDYNRWLDDIAPYRQRHSTKHTQLPLANKWNCERRAKKKKRLTAVSVVRCVYI